MVCTDETRPVAARDPGLSLTRAAPYLAIAEESCGKIQTFSLALLDKNGTSSIHSL